jgi:hypothetical protein
LPLPSTNIASCEASGAMLRKSITGHFLFLGEVERHEAVTADVAGAGQRDGKRKAHGHGGVDGIAATCQHAGRRWRWRPRSG